MLALKLMTWWPRLLIGWMCGYFGMEVGVVILTSLGATAVGEALIIRWIQQGELPLVILAALFYAAMGVDCRSRLWRRGATWL